MASQSEIAQRWAEQVGRENPRYLLSRSSNVFVSGDRIYSYGSHFELGRLVGSRERGFFLLNGDRYSVTTSGHQNLVRSSVADTGIPSAIIPYSALSAAGIELDSIRPLDVQPDRVDRWTEDIGPAWTLNDSHSKNTSWEAAPDSEYPFPSYMHGLPGRVARRWRLDYGEGAHVHAVETLRGYEYSEGRYVNYRPGENVTYFTSEGSGVRIIEGRFHVERFRHFLGACFFTARVRGRKTRAKFLSAFDENERRPLYFLCELPRCNARTYAEALDALAPRIVHAALAQEREVVRQGDIFAIPTELDRKTLRKRGAIFARYRADDGMYASDGKTRRSEILHLLDSNHVATEVARVGQAVYARGCLYHAVINRDPDHARRKMGDGKAWHLIAKNTVPQTRAASQAGAMRL